MPIYIYITEKRDNYLNASGSLCQYYRDVPSIANCAIIDFTDANHNSRLFNYK